MKAPLPKNESERLAELQAYQILDTAADPDFDDLALLASQICGTPIAAITLIDERRQWLKAKVGLNISETPREIAFCDHTILATDPLIVRDASKDERFQTNPLVTGDPHIRFYAAAPLITKSGHALGTLCVIDLIPRSLTAEQTQALAALSRQVVNQMELRRAMAAFKESERRFGDAFDHAPNGMAMLGMDGEFLKVNRALCKLFGYNEAELLAMSLGEITDADDRKFADEQLKLLREGSAKNLQIEQRYRDANGRQLSGHLSVSLARDAAFGPDFFIAQFQDITQTRLAEIEAQESRRFLQSTLDSLSAHIAILDEKGVILEVNEAWRHFGEGNQYKNKAFGIGTDYLKVCENAIGPYAEGAAKVAAGIREVLKGQRTEFHHEYPCHSPNEKRWFVVHITCFNEPFMRVVVAHENITIRKQAEENWRQEQEFLAVLIDNVTDGIVSCDQDGTLTLFNRATKRLHDSPESALSPDQWATRFGLFRPDGMTLMRKEEIPLYRALNEGAIKDVEMVIRSGDKPPVRVLCSGQSLFDATGEKKGAVVAMRDITAQRAAEESIRSQAYMLDQIGQAVIATDIKGSIQYANEAAEALYGWSREEMLERNIMEVTVPKATRAQAEEIMQRLTAGEAWSGEFLVQDRSGRVFPAFVTNSPLYIDGNLSGIVGISTDITEQVETEVTLRKNERESRELAASLELRRLRMAEAQAVAKFGSWETDLATMKVEWSEETYRIFERPFGSEITHQQFLDFVHPEDRAAVKRAFEASRETSGRNQIKHRICLSGGREKFLEENWQVEFDAKGKPLRAYGTCQDVTEREVAENALRRSEALFRTVVQNSWGGFHLVNDQGVIIYESPAITRMLGYQPSEVVGRHAIDFVHPDDTALVTSNIPEFLAEPGAVRELILRVKDREGAWRWLESYEVNLLHQPEVKAVAASFRDITERKEAEDALRLFSAAVAQSNDSILITDAQIDQTGPKIVYANPAFTRLTGYTPQEVIGKTPDLFQGPKTDPDVIRRLRNCLQKGEIFQGVAINYRKDGSPYDQEWQITPLRNAQGEVTNFLSIQHDISDRKKTETKLVELERLYRHAIGAAGAVPYSLNYDSHSYVFMGEGIEELIGYPVAEVTPNLWQKIIQETKMAGASAGLSEQDAANRVREGTIKEWKCDIRIVNRAGKSRWMSDSSVQILHESGKPLGSIGIIQDITERKQAELTALAFSELGRRLNAAVTEKEAFMIVADISERLFDWDAFGLNLCGNKPDLIHSQYSIDTINGEKVFQESQVPHDPSTTFKRVIQNGAQMIRREARAEEDFVPFGDVTRKSAVILYVPIHSYEKRVGAFAVHIYTPNAYGEADLNTLQTMADQCGGAFQRIWANDALHQSEAKLFQSQKLETVGKLAGGIAHEFNSILTAIMGQSELLISDSPPKSKQSVMALEINQAAKRAAGLTRQLLAYGRKQMLKPRVLDLNLVLSGMDQILTLMLGSKIKRENVRAMDLRPVRADPSQIEQVIMNLSVNARDAMPAGGVLTFETANILVTETEAANDPDAKPGPFVMLAISDTGTGMSDEVKARLFDPFFTTKGIGKGTGLGLATCYGIVKQSGGFITVRSELGRGTTFKIYLPEDSKQLKPEKAPQRSGLPGGDETIMLVENDPALREMAVTLLRRLGYTVIPASGAEALRLELTEAQGVDVLLVDFTQASSEGENLTDRLRLLHPEARVLYMSAYPQPPNASPDGLKSDFLQKPFSPSALARKLREVLDQPPNGN